VNSLSRFGGNSAVIFAQVVTAEPVEPGSRKKELARDVWDLWINNPPPNKHLYISDAIVADIMWLVEDSEYSYINMRYH
jgi:hypothetical protein